MSDVKNRRRLVYDRIGQMGVELPDYNTFESRLEDDGELRRHFYETLQQQGFQVPDFDSFDQTFRPQPQTSAPGHEASTLLQKSEERSREHTERAIGDRHIPYKDASRRMADMATQVHQESEREDASLAQTDQTSGPGLEERRPGDGPMKSGLVKRDDEEISRIYGIQNELEGLNALKRELVGDKEDPLGYNTPVVGFTSNRESVDAEEEKLRKKSIRTINERQKELQAELKDMWPGYWDRVKNLASSIARGASELPAGFYGGQAVVEKTLDDLHAKYAPWADQEVESIEDLPSYRAAESIRKAAEEWFPTDPAMQESFIWSQAPSGVGSMLAYIGLGFATRGVGQTTGGASPLATAGTVGTTAGFSGMSMAFEEAIQHGLEPEEAIKAARWGFIPGVIQTANVVRLLNRFEKMSAGRFRQGMLRHLVEEGAKSGINEAIVESLGQVGFNKIAQAIYDEDRELVENVIDSGSVGGFAGTFSGLLVSALGRRAGMAHSRNVGQPTAVDADNITLEQILEEGELQRIQEEAGEVEGKVTAEQKEQDKEFQERVTHRRESSRNREVTVGDAVGQEVEIDGQRGRLQIDDEGTVIVDIGESEVEVPGAMKDQAKSLYELDLNLVPKPKVSKTEQGRYEIIRELDAAEEMSYEEGRDFQLPDYKQTSKKGLEYTYYRNTEVDTEDGTKTTTFTFHRSDKPAEQRNPAGVPIEHTTIEVTDQNLEESGLDGVDRSQYDINVREIREDPQGMTAMPDQAAVVDLIHKTDPDHQPNFRGVTISATYRDPTTPQTESRQYRYLTSNTNDAGEVVSVTMQNEQGEQRTFRDPDIVDQIAWQEFFDQRRTPVEMPEGVEVLPETAEAETRQDPVFEVPGEENTKARIFEREDGKYAIQLFDEDAGTHFGITRIDPDFDRAKRYAESIARGEPFETTPAEPDPSDSFTQPMSQQEQTESIDQQLETEPIDDATGRLLAVVEDGDKRIDYIFRQIEEGEQVHPANLEYARSWIDQKVDRVVEQNAPDEQKQRVLDILEEFYEEVRQLSQGEAETGGISTDPAQPRAQPAEPAGEATATERRPARERVPERPEDIETRGRAQPPEQQRQQQETPQDRRPDPAESERVFEGRMQPVADVPIESIHVDTGRFQERANAFSEQTARRIHEEYDPNLFDPIVLWNDPKSNETYVLAGHSRLEGFRRRDETHIPARFFDGNEAEAIRFSLIENSSADVPTNAERSGYPRRLREAGWTMRDIEQESRKLYGRDAPAILAYSWLNPEGKAMQSLAALSKTTTDDSRTMETMAQWVGETRRRHPGLTDSHETEIFNFLNENFKTVGRRFSNKRDFHQYIDQAIDRKTIIGKFESGEPLNLNRIRPQSVVESEWEARNRELEQQVREQRQLVEPDRKTGWTGLKMDMVARLKTEDTEQATRKAEQEFNKPKYQEIYQRKLQKEKAYLKTLQNKLAVHKAQKTQLDAEVRGQGGLFESVDAAEQSLKQEGITDGEIENIKNQPDGAIAEAERSVESAEAEAEQRQQSQRRGRAHTPETDRSTQRDRQESVEPEAASGAFASGDPRVARQFRILREGLQLLNLSPDQRKRTIAKTYKLNPQETARFEADLKTYRDQLEELHGIGMRAQRAYENLQQQPEPIITPVPQAPEGATRIRPTEGTDMVSQRPSQVTKGVTVTPEAIDAPPTTGERALYLAPKKPLEVSKRVRVRGFGRGGTATPATTGMKAARQLLGIETFEEAQTMRERRFINWISEEYPDVPWPQLFPDADRYAMMETVGAIEARREGYDALIGTDQHIALSDEALVFVGEAPSDARAEYNQATETLQQQAKRIYNEFEALEEVVRSRDGFAMPRPEGEPLGDVESVLVEPVESEGTILIHDTQGQYHDIFHDMGGQWDQRSQAWRFSDTDRGTLAELVTTQRANANDHFTVTTRDPSPDSYGRAPAFVREDGRSNTGRKLVERIKADPEGQKYGVRSIVDMMIKSVHSQLRIGRTQLRKKYPAMYYRAGHFIRSHVGAWQLNFHEAGHALSQLMTNADDAWMNPFRNELLAIANRPASHASADTAEEGFAEFVRLFIVDPASLNQGLRNRIMSKVRQHHPDIADSVEDAARAWFQHRNRTVTAQQRSYRNDRGGLSVARRFTDEVNNVKQLWNWILYKAVSAEKAIDRYKEQVFKALSTHSRETARQFEQRVADTPADPTLALQSFINVQSEVALVMQGQKHQREGIRLLQIGNKSIREQLSPEDVQTLESLGYQIPEANPGHGNYTYLFEKSVSKLQSEIGAERWDDFQEYGFMKESLHRFERKGHIYPGMRDNLPPSMIRQEVARLEEQNPDFPQYFNEVTQYFDQIAVVAFMGGEKTAQDLVRMKKGIDHYWPMNRVLEKRAGMGAMDGARPESGIRAAKEGSHLAPRSLEEAFELRTKRALEAYYWNNVILSTRNYGQQLAEMEDAPYTAKILGARLMAPLRPDILLKGQVSESEQKQIIADYLNEKRLEEKQLATGDPEAELTAEEKVAPGSIELTIGNYTLWRPSEPVTAKLVAPFENGQRRYYEVEDPILFDFFANSRQPHQFVREIQRTLAPVSDAVKDNLTHNVVFSSWQYVSRDHPLSMMMSEGWQSYVPGFYHISGMLNRIKSSTNRKLGTNFKAYDTPIEYGAMLTKGFKLVGTDAHKSRWENFQEILKNRIIIPRYSDMTMLEKIQHAPQQLTAAVLKPVELFLWGTGQRVASVTMESLPREGRAIQILKEGGSIQKANREFGRVIGNFGMFPGSANAHALYRIAMLVNPGLQVFYSNYQRLTHYDPKVRAHAWAVKLPYISLIAAAGAAANYLMTGEEEREEMKQRYDDNRMRYMSLFGKLRVPFDYGITGVAQSIGHNTMESYLLQDPISGEAHARAVLQRMMDMPGSPSSLVQPHLLALLETKVNYSFFFQESIVPPWMEAQYQFNPELQHYDSTPLVYRKAGEHLSISPLKIQHFMRQGMGNQLDEFIGLGSAMLEGREEQVRQLADIPFFGRAFTREPRGHLAQDVKSLRDLSQEYQAAKQQFNELKQQEVFDEDEARMLQERAAGLEDAFRAYSKISEYSRHVRNERRKEHPDHDRIEELERQMVVVASEFMDWEKLQEE